MNKNQEIPTKSLQKSQLLELENDLVAYKLFQDLHNIDFPKKIALTNYLTLVIYNKKNHVFSFNDLQHTWLKLHRKYKFKYKEWQNLNHEENIHTYLFNTNGDGLQSIIRFYRDRNLTDWKNDAFEFGMESLIDLKRFDILDMYFLNSLICEEWEINYLSLNKVKSFFSQSKYPKTKELYINYENFMKNATKETAHILLKNLAKLNPHYSLQSKTTPLFFKNLYELSKS